MSMENFNDWLWKTARWCSWFTLHHILKLISLLLRWMSELATTASKVCGRKIGI